MRTSRFSDEQIIGIVREYEAGAKLTGLCRRHNVSPTTFYKWRAKYGGMAVSDAKRLKALEEENRRLKQVTIEDAALSERMVFDLMEDVNAEGRRTFLAQRARKYTNIDV